jgi:hydrogenase maturation protein HypF
VAFLAGGPPAVSFEAQAALWLEGMASDGEGDCYDFTLEAQVIDTRPLIRGVWDDARHGHDPRVIARRFHATLARIVAHTCAHLAEAGGPRDVALTGGVFCNAVLLEATERRLLEVGLRPHVHRRVPANDGGLSLGQLAVAAARDQEGRR